jgi:hypothetical protein
MGELQPIEVEFSGGPEDGRRVTIYIYPRAPGKAPSD